MGRHSVCVPRASSALHDAGHAVCGRDGHGQLGQVSSGGRSVRRVDRLRSPERAQNDAAQVVHVLAAVSSTGSSLRLCLKLGQSRIE